MPAHIVVVNGPPGVGKTSVALALRDLLPGSVCIGGDALRHFAPGNAREVLGPGSTYRAAAVLASFYLNAGAPRVIVEYVFETPSQLDYFRKALAPGIRWQAITLWAPLATIEERDTSRSDPARLGARVAACVATMSAHLDGLGCVVDTTALSVLEVAHRVDQVVRDAYEHAV